MPGTEPRYELNPTVVSTGLSDGTSVLLDLSKETYFGLNTVGTKIWGMLGVGTTAGEIVSSLTDEFGDVEPDRIRQDVDEVLSELVSKGIVRLVTGFESEH